MNLVDVWLAYQGITRVADNQNYFYNYLSEEVIYNTYDRFMIWCAEGRKRTHVDSNEKNVDDKNPLFDQINDASICVIVLHVNPNKNGRNKSYGIETLYLLQDECKVYWNNTTHVCSDCADTDAVKNEMWVCYPKTNHFCFAQHVNSTHEL